MFPSLLVKLFLDRDIDADVSRKLSVRKLRILFLMLQKGKMLAVNLSKLYPFLVCELARTHLALRKYTMDPYCDASRSVALQSIHRYPDGNVQGLARVFQHACHDRQSGAVASLLHIGHRYLLDGGVALQHRVHWLQKEYRLPGAAHKNGATFRLLRIANLWDRHVRAVHPSAGGRLGYRNNWCVNCYVGKWRKRRRLELG